MGVFLHKKGSINQIKKFFFFSFFLIEKKKISINENFDFDLKFNCCDECENGLLASACTSFFTEKFKRPSPSNKQAKHTVDHKVDLNSVV